MVTYQFGSQLFAAPCTFSRCVQTVQVICWSIPLCRHCFSRQLCCHRQEGGSADRPSVLSTLCVFYFVILQHMHFFSSDSHCKSFNPYSTLIPYLPKMHHATSLLKHACTGFTSCHEFRTSSSSVECIESLADDAFTVNGDSLRCFRVSGCRLQG